MAVSGPYAESFAYDQVGDLTSKGGPTYNCGDVNNNYAVTSVGSTGCAYHFNGNMTSRLGQWLGDYNPL